MNKEVVIFGTGGHAKVVHDILVKEGQYTPVAFFSLENTLQTFLGLPHFHQNSFKQSRYTQGVVAVGDNWTRSKVTKLILSEKNSFIFVNAIHPSAQVGTGVVLGTGNVVMANAVINPYSKIGSHVIINTSSSIDHDCQLDDYSSVAPGVVLGGNVRLGEFSAISLGTKVIHNKKIGKHSVIGAGALVLKDFDDYSVAYGVPCRFIRKRVENEKYL
jgi:sugar O-acyltransferase (sialic acid O-acetyltransferase NeuD family)